jgi:hypothetical protein
MKMRCEKEIKMKEGIEEDTKINAFGKHTYIQKRGPINSRHEGNKNK